MPKSADLLIFFCVAIIRIVGYKLYVLLSGWLVGEFSLSVRRTIFFAWRPVSMACLHILACHIYVLWVVLLYTHLGRLASILWVTLWTLIWAAFHPLRI
jgi:hypothetical protein